MRVSAVERIWRAVSVGQHPNIRIEDGDQMEQPAMLVRMPALPTLRLLLFVFVWEALAALGNGRVILG